jgi:NADPH2:quinone reductase
VTIRVEYAGLNFVDVLARRGVPGYSTGWPFVPGMEVGGTIHGLGHGADGSPPGTGSWHLPSAGIENDISVIPQLTRHFVLS